MEKGLPSKALPLIRTHPSINFLGCIEEYHNVIVVKFINLFLEAIHKTGDFFGKLVSTAQTKLLKLLYVGLRVHEPVILLLSDVELELV